MKKDIKKMLFVLAAVVVSVAVAASLITYSITKNSMKSGEIYIKTDEYGTMMKYFEMEDIADVLANSYYAEVDEEVITVGALEGMVAALDDGYSRFYSEEDFKYFDAGAIDSYVAMGMLLRKDKTTDYVRVDHVFADTPAYDMNMNAGDLIVSVDGKDTAGMDIDCAVSRIRGREGTEVVLQVIPQDGSQVEIKIPRKTLTLQMAFSNMLDSSYGYIDVVEFSGTSVEDFEKAIRTIKDEGAEAIILDLRGVPGGYISQAAEVADMLMNEGIIYTVKGKLEANTKTVNAKNNALWTQPIVVLTDEQTEGVAEILAAALSENGRAIVVGKQTMGKGVATSLIKIGDTGDGMKLVTAEYITPLGNKLNGAGVKPDYEVDQAAESAQDSDAQLEFALQILEQPEE